VERSDTHQLHCEGDGFREVLNPSYGLDTSGKSAAFFIIVKSVKMTAGAQRRLFDVTSGETPSSMIGRSIVTASMH
jgi:hypothetical protein